MSHALVVEELVKRYGDVVAVDRLSFSVGRGEIFGLLGPNGAGKTTTLEVVEGLQPPDAGRAIVLGLDVVSSAREIKSRIGVQLQSSSYFEYLTLLEILAMLGRFYSRRLPAAELLARVNLQDKGARRVRQLSGGEQQRFALAASIVNDPELVILDEPTTGLDPVSRRDLWGLVGDVRDSGATVIVTTHYIEEAQEHCDRVAIINRGKLVDAGSPSELIGRVEASYAVEIEMAHPLDATQIASLGLRAETDEAATVGQTYLRRLDSSANSLQQFLDGVSQTGVAIEHLQITPVSLEDVFIELTSDPAP